jgi:hypothetical protein
VGFGPRSMKLRERGLSYFWFHILNEFYSNSNDF